MDPVQYKNINCCKQFGLFMKRNVKQINFQMLMGTLLASLVCALVLGSLDKPSVNIST